MLVQIAVQVPSLLRYLVDSTVRGADGQPVFKLVVRDLAGYEVPQQLGELAPAVAIDHGASGRSNTRLSGGAPSRRRRPLQPVVRRPAASCSESSIHHVITCGRRIEMAHRGLALLADLGASRLRP